MKRDIYKLLAEKYEIVQENPLETEITPDGGHKSDHNVEMARTKAKQVTEIAPKLHEILEKMDANAPLKAWMVTHVTEAADMLQDVLAKLEEETETVEPVAEEGDGMESSDDTEERSGMMGENWGVKNAVHPSKKGMFKGKTKGELKKQVSKLKATEPHKKGSAAYTKQKELNFAIRAKSGWGKAK